MTEDRELFPCPFCGNKEVRTYRLTHEGVYISNCTRCMSHGPQCISAAKADEAWNTRANWQKAKPDRGMLKRLCDFYDARYDGQDWDSFVDQFFARESRREAGE